jgi:ubiquinone biosynthesis protein Coq4
MWDKLNVIYEGDRKIKKAKLQTYRTQFENLKMKEEENIVEYLQRVDEVVNSIKVLGEELKDQPIVQKILRSLPMRYDSNISTLEDRPNLDNLRMDELHGILTVYEMRIGQEIPTKGETNFKVYKEKKKQEQVSNEDQSEISDEEITNFMKKLKKGTGRYKGKFPQICFKCGKIGHFSTKCPYPKQK